MNIPLSLPLDTVPKISSNGTHLIQYLSYPSHIHVSHGTYSRFIVLSATVLERRELVAEHILAVYKAHTYLLCHTRQQYPDL